MFTEHDISRNACQLTGNLSRCGYDWWWHSFTARDPKTGKTRPFYIEYYLCNPALGDKEPIFGDLSTGKRPSYLMVNVGTWGRDAKQLHRFFGWKQISVSWGTPFSVRAGDCFVTEDRLRGSIRVTPEKAARPELMTDAGEVKWDLWVQKVVPFNVGYGAGKLFRKLQLFEMFWHAEGMKSRYSGEIWLDGVRYIVEPETSFGYADKNWGKNFTSPWVWLTSCDLKSERTGLPLKNSVFDIGGGQPKIGPVPLSRKLLSAFYYEGQLYEFNFSKFWTFTRTKFRCRETDDKILWHIEQTSTDGKMVTDIACKKADMLLIRYEAPTGEKRHTRLWNGGNGVGRIKLYRHGRLIDVIRAEKVGCEYGEFDAQTPYK